MNLDAMEDFDKISKLIAKHKGIRDDIIKAYLSILKKRNFNYKQLAEHMGRETRFHPKESWLSEKNVKINLINVLLKHELISLVGGKNRYSPIAPRIIIDDIFSDYKKEEKILKDAKEILEEVWEFSEESGNEEEVSWNFKNIKGLFTELIEKRKILKELIIIDKDLKWVEYNSSVFQDKDIKKKVRKIRNDSYATGIILCNFDGQKCVYFKIYNPVTTVISPVKVQDDFLFDFLKTTILEENNHAKK